MTKVRSILSLTNSVRPLLLFACFATQLFFTSKALAQPTTFNDDVNVQGDVTLSDPAALTGGPGFWLNYTDGTTAIATFGLDRLQGEWHWQMATSVPNTDRIQMTLGNGNALSLFDPANNANKIVLDPAAASITINGVPVVAGSNITNTAGHPVISGGLELLKTSGGSALYLNPANGNLGLGTTSPSSLLTLQGAGAAINLNATGATDDVLETFSQNGVARGKIGYRQSSGALAFWESGSDRMVIKNGKVGVGTAAPGYMLDVFSPDTFALRIVNQSTSGPSSGGGIQSANVGTPSAAGHRLGFFTIGAEATVDSGNTNSLAIVGYSSQAWTPTAKGSDLDFQTIATNSTSRTTKVRLTADGALGIGTTTPQKKLHVAGDVKVDGMIILAGPAGDIPMF